MLPVHTQESLNALTWNEIQKLHTNLKLKATATTRSRADYEARILAAQPQPIAESAPATMTCSTCPLARHIDGNRYCCTVPQTANDVKRGHWEATVACKEAIAQVEAEAQEVSVTPAPEVEVTIEATEPIAEAEAPIAPVSPAPFTAPEPAESPTFQPAATPVRKSYYKRHPFRYEWDVYQGGHSFTSSIYGLCECDQCVPPAQPKVEEVATIDLAPDRIWTIDEIEEKMSKLKADVLAGCRLPATKPSEAHIKLKPRPFRAYVAPELEPEIIVWKTPFQGQILGKKEKYRPFFVEADTIYIVLDSRASLFCAIEGRHQNYHHTVIRQAVNVGKSFDLAAFKKRADARGCPSLKYFTYWWKNADGRSCNLGQLYQNCDGWWWAWSNQQQREGQKFQTKELACKYLQAEHAERPYKFTFAEA